MSPRAASSRKKRKRSGARKAKLGHDPVSEVAVADLQPSPENNEIYRPPDPSDPEILALAQSIREHGVKEPLVVTKDRYILSGHRRHAAAKLAGLRTVPCRTEATSWSEDPSRALQLLREFNRQRVKTLAERVREEIISANPDEEYEALIEHRRQQNQIRAEPLRIRGEKRRCAITRAKAPFLAAIIRVVNKLRAYWPLSDRGIHYGLLNDPPLKHASKPQSVYDNTARSYRSLVELLTRARLAGHVPMEAIADDTRPVVTWHTFQEPGAFVREELNGLFKRYFRDLQQSQPHHIEIVGEKNTVAPILKRVAMRYCIPLTTGRGYCSLPPRAAIAERYEKSGKDQLILLLVTDFDPDGEEIAESMARSMRDDFLLSVHPVKVALTAEQVEERQLPPIMKAKASSAHHQKFTEEYGDDVFELEALEPKDLQRILTSAIDSVLDVDAFNKELKAEKADAARLAAIRRTVHEAIEDALDLEDDAITP